VLFADCVRALLTLALLSPFICPFVRCCFALDLFAVSGFEISFQIRHIRPYWDVALALGSGGRRRFASMLLGSLRTGRFRPMSTAYPACIWRHGRFSILTGFFVMAGYALFGRVLLVHEKSRTHSKTHSRQTAKRALAHHYFSHGHVELWTVASQVDIRQRWFSGFQLFLAVALAYY